MGTPSVRQSIRTILYCHGVVICEPGNRVSSDWFRSLLTFNSGSLSRRILINHFFFGLSVPTPNKENCERVLLCLEFENRIRNGAKRCPAVLMWRVFPCFYRLWWLFGHFVDCDVKLQVIQPRFRSHDTPWPSSWRMAPGEYYIPTQPRFRFRDPPWSVSCTCTLEPNFMWTSNSRAFVWLG